MSATFSEIFRTFYTSGLKDKSNLELLEKLFTERSFGKESSKNAQLYLAKFLQTCRVFLEENEELKKPRKCAQLIKYFHDGFEFMIDTGLFKDEDLKHDRVFILQLTFHFARVVLGKINDFAKDGKAISELVDVICPLITTIRENVEIVVDESGGEKKEKALQVSSSFYCILHNDFGLTLSERSADLQEDCMRLFLQCFPLKHLKESNLAGEITWIDRLLAFLKDLLSCSNQTVMTVSESLVGMLKLCSGLSVPQILPIFSKLAQLAVADIGLDSDFEKTFDGLLVVWEDYLLSCSTPESARLTLLTMKGTAALHLFGRKFALLSSAVKELLRANAEAKKERGKAGSTKVKLNFDGEVEEPSSNTAVHSDCISREDEEFLLAPLIEVSRQFESFFHEAKEPCSVDVVDEVVAVLVDISYLLQASRKTYDALRCCLLAWNIATKLTEDTTSRCSAAAALMRNLTILRMHEGAAMIFEKTRDVVEEAPFDVAGSLLVEAAWSHLFLLKEDALIETLKRLEKLISTQGKDSPWQHIFQAQILRVKAFGFVAGLCKEDALQSCLQTPLSLLESARMTVVDMCGTGYESLRLRVGICWTFMQCCLDLARLLVNVGAAVEAKAYAECGRNMAKKCGMRRWVIAFAAKEARIAHAINRVEDFNKLLQETDSLLTSRYPSMLSFLQKLVQKRQATKKAGKGIPAVLSETDLLSSDLQRMNMREPNSESESEVRSSRDEDGFSSKSTLILSTGSCRCSNNTQKNKDKLEKPCSSAEYCADCLDVDLQVIMMECAYLKYVAADENHRRRFMTKCIEAYNHRFKPAQKSILELAALSVSKDEKKRLLKSGLPVEPPLTKLRLASSAFMMQDFKPLGKDPEDRDRQEKIVQSILDSGKQRSDLLIFHPEISALAHYLDVLYKLVSECKSLSSFRNLVRTLWSFDHLTKVIDNHPFKGYSKGEVIPDALTEMLNSRNHAATPLRDLGVLDNKGAPEKKQKARSRHVAKSGDVDEPELPSDMEEEIKEQTKVLAKRRMTILSGDILGSISERKENSESPSENGQSKREEFLAKIRSSLREWLEGMNQFPIHPYHRSGCLLLLILNGISARTSDLEELTVSPVSSKLHHLALFNSSKMLNKVDSPTESDFMRSQIAHLAFTPESCALRSDYLPEDWVVCSLYLITKSGFSICSTSADDRIIAIAVTRWERDTKPITLVSTVPESMQADVIITLNEVHREAAENQKSHRNPTDYWRKRLWLNQEVYEIQEIMEQLLGCVKGLLLTFPKDKAEIKAVEKKMKELQTKAVLFKLKLPHNVCRILALAGMALPEDLFLDLASRLLRLPKNADAVEALSSVACKGKSDKSCFYKRSPLILILDKEAYQLPWESIPTLRDHPVSRMSSIKLLNLYLEKYRDKILRKDRGFFILNPDGDLKQLQNTFEELFRQLRSSNWGGVMGKPPSKEEMKAVFKEKNLLLYMGHGSGAHHFDNEGLQKLRTAASMFLIGCSSVKQQYSVWMDSSGFLDQLLIAGSPFIVGNLWPVTSGCIDSWMQSILSELFDEADGSTPTTKRSFLELFAISRERIRSQFLVGSAPVAIGLPMCF